MIASEQESSQCPKVLGIRCPVHRYITFKGPMMPRLINTKAFQRLREITQLGACTKVFPAANHKRFDHCLGVAYLCVQYARIVDPVMLLRLPNGPCEGTVEDLLAAAGLLHDIAHGPFSHDWDRAVYSKIYPSTDKGHDEVRKLIVLEDPEIGEALALGGLTPMNIIDAWKTKPFSQIINGPMSADQMDYICRDSKMLGMEHLGGVDPKRIIANALIITTADGGGELRFRDTCRTDIDLFHRTRQLAYEHVYWHKKVQQYALLIRQMMDRLITKEPQIVTVEMRSAVDLRRWTEPYFFHRYWSAFGVEDPLYQQWANRTIGKQNQ